MSTIFCSRRCCNVKCTTCGKALSLRMTHCSLCGTPVSYTTNAQPVPSYTTPFTTSPPVTPRQVDVAQYGVYAQPVHYIQTQQSISSPYISGVQSTMSQQTTKKRRWDGLFILAIVVCVLLLFGIGAYKLIKVTNTANISKQANTPSGNAFVASASAVLKNAQPSSDIDSNLAPTQTTKMFMANQKVYMTFVINSGSRDGYIEAKWYADGQVVASTVLSHTHGNTRGVFSHVYITATPDGAVELYWCVQADCKDAQLAQVVHFVVTPVNTAHIHSPPYNIAQHFGKLHAFLVIQWQQGHTRQTTITSSEVERGFQSWYAIYGCHGIVCWNESCL